MSGHPGLSRLRSAGVLVNVYPSGEKGKVRVSAESVGPVHLDKHEIITVLRTAAGYLERGQGTWLDPEDN